MVLENFHARLRLAEVDPPGGGDVCHAFRISLQVALISEALDLVFVTSGLR